VGKVRMHVVCRDPEIEAWDMLLHRYISSTSGYLLSVRSPNEPYGASVGMDMMSVVVGWGTRGLERAHSPKMQYAWRQGSRALSASVCVRNPAKGMCTSDHAMSAMPPCCFPSWSMLMKGMFSLCMSHKRNQPMLRPC
jgi:hypothetical protein